MTNEVNMVELVQTVNKTYELVHMVWYVICTILGGFIGMVVGAVLIARREK